MEITRRAMLTFLGMEGIYAFAGCKREEPSQQVMPSPQRKVDTASFSLQELSRYEPFTSQVRDLGFELLPVRYGKKPEREVLFIGEAHGTNTSKIMELVDLGIARYGFDSIGMEAFYGGLSLEGIEHQLQEIKAVVGNTEISPVTFTIQTKTGPKPVEIQQANLLENLVPEYNKFVREEAVPIYGIEHRDTHLTALIFQAYQGAINMANDISRLVVSSGATPFTYPVPFLRELEVYVQKLRKKQHLLDLPPLCLYETVLAAYLFEGGKVTSPVQYSASHEQYHNDIDLPCSRELRSFASLEDLLEHIKRYEEGYNDFRTMWKTLVFDVRTEQATNKIVEQMERLNSRKSIVIVGATHVFREIQFPQGKGRYRYTIPNLLPYTSLSINATGMRVKT